MSNIPAPIEISLRFSSDEKVEDSRINVSLFRPDSGAATVPASFTPPLDDQVLDDLSWYLETFSTWPTGPDYERARLIESRLEDWGRQLLANATANREATKLWQQFVDAPDESKLVTIDATDPRVLRLPWELLADDGGHIFGQGIGVRRRLRQSTTAPVKPFALPVRVLVLVSRPDDAGFIDGRAVSMPLLDALDEMGPRAVVEFLPTPTLKALTERLRDKKAPPVHVVHFDGHGVYDDSLGLGYLLFEDEQHKSDRVDANRLGTLLNRCGVPLMVLNACQSAAQEQTNPYASVAARLIRAGVGSVLAMNYSVLVVAARKFVAAFYEALAEGLTVGQAVDQGRFALLADEKRHAVLRYNDQGDLEEQTVKLRDWFLPALYQQSADPVVFDIDAPLPDGLERPATPCALTDSQASGGLPTQPRHGFHGRAYELLQVERAFAEHRVVVLHGFGGQGKTTLAADAGRWFQRTGRFPGGAAFVSFEHGGSLQQLCSWVGQAVSDDPNFVLGDGDMVERVGKLLRERPALLILDNFESVLGSAPLMPVEELRAVLDAVWSWVDDHNPKSTARSRVLITTRDTSFSDQRYKPSRQCAHIELGGLATADALALAAAVLDDNGIDRGTIKRQELVMLVERLGGHPLSLNLALPHLRDHTPTQLNAGFEALLPGFSSGAAKERNESLMVSLEFSLRRLGEATRAALPDLAVFQGGAMEYDLLAITQIDPQLWQAARAELEQAALVTVEPIENVTWPFLRFHPTLAPYLAARLPAERRTDLEARYWHEYYRTANSLYEFDTQHPHEARTIARRELPNLLRALDLALAAGANAEAVDFASRIGRFLDYFGRWREHATLQQKIAALTFDSTGGITKAECLRQRGRGEALLQAGRAAEATALFAGLLQRLEAGAAYDAAYDQAMTLAWLGRCMKAQGQSTYAISYNRRALASFEQLSEGDKAVKQMIGAVHTELADLYTALGQFIDAENEYKAALAIDEELGDERGKGVDLIQLGTLAYRRGDLAEAGKRYAEALKTFQDLGEPQSEAVAWHQLGMVAEQARAWEQAERCYRESLRLKEQLNDLSGVARTCNQLAGVAEGAGRPDEAERWYLRAQEIKDRVAPQNTSTLNNLADLYLKQGRLAEADHYARRAVQIDEQINDPSTEIWKDYSILASIASAQGRADEAASWRRKEQESYAAYAGSAHTIRQWQPAIAETVRLCQAGVRPTGDFAAYLDRMGQSDDWRNVIAAIRRILAGERDIEQLRGNLDRTDFVIIKAILAQLSGAAVPEPAAPQPASQPQQQEEQQGITLEQLLNLVVQACKPDAPAGMAAQLHGLTRQLATDGDAPAEIRALGRALNAILSGERGPDLAGLTPELAEAVREVIGAL